MENGENFVGGKRQQHLDQGIWIRHPLRTSPRRCSKTAKPPCWIPKNSCQICRTHHRWQTKTWISCTCFLENQFIKCIHICAYIRMYIYIYIIHICCFNSHLGSFPVHSAENDGSDRCTGQVTHLMSLVASTCCMTEHSPKTGK